MNDAEALATSDPEWTAYYAGRAAADFGGKCGFTDPKLIAAWVRGKRHVLEEDELDADTEWDED